MNPGDLDGLGGAHVRVAVERWQDGAARPDLDDVAEECPVALIFNGVPFAVMLASPLDLEDFALGFSWSEGVIASPDEFQATEIVRENQGYSIYINVPRERSAVLADRRRSLAGRTGCGLCGAQMLEEAIRPVRAVAPSRIDACAIQRAHASLASRQPLNAVTGAVHAAAWADAAGDVQCLREDVGRHNALDKLIGALLRSGRDASTGFVAVTSRASYEMVHKTASAGIPMLSAVSAPTALAIRTAADAGLTLVGFTRDGRHTVYSPTP